SLAGAAGSNGEIVGNGEVAGNGEVVVPDPAHAESTTLISTTHRHPFMPHLPFGLRNSNVFSGKKVPCCPAADACPIPCPKYNTD
ncbi:MAG TPA: hypothetical protein PLQ85_13175, partial [Anaerolineae bacterium]|nr:hypothetical protein [Anaerolineae bacterium]